MSTIATSQRLRNVSRMTSWNRNPRMPIGIVPMMTIHPMRASGSLRGTAPVSERNQRPMMRTIFFQK